MVCMEMMLAGVKIALTKQQFRVPQDLRDLASGSPRGHRSNHTQTETFST